MKYDYIYSTNKNTLVSFFTAEKKGMFSENTKWDPKPSQNFFPQNFFIKQELFTKITL